MKNNSKIRFIAVLGLALATFLGNAQTQVNEEVNERQKKVTAEEVIRTLQNPLSNISALMSQHNFGAGAEGANGPTYNLVLQPLHATQHKKFNLLHSGMFGAGYMPGIMVPPSSEVGSIPGKWGISDLNYQVMYTPKKMSRVLWSVGPSITVPTATDPMFGRGKVTAGVSGIGVYVVGKVSFVAVVRQDWSIAGNPERQDVNMMTAQPIIGVNLGKGWGISTNPTVRVNWNAEDGENVTLPLGAGVQKVVMLGRLPMSLGAQYYYNALRPTGAPQHEFRLAMGWIFKM